ncbi:MAG: S1C family serine protease [Acidimicrobiales bacterium]
MYPEDFDPGDDDHVAPLLPPEDRVWRHPSEMAAERRAAADAQRAPTAGRRRLTGVGATALGVLGGGLLLAGLALTLGSVSGGGEQTITGEGDLLPVSRSFSVPDTSWTDELQAAVDASTPIVTVTGPDGTTVGAGLVFSHGHILTSLSLVQSGTVEVTAGRFTRTGLLIGTDPLNDLAVLAVDDVYEVADLGLGDNVRLGQYAIVHDVAAETLRVDGRVLSLARSVDFADTRLHGLLAYSSPEGAPIPGAAVFDAEGRVIGVTVAATTGDDALGLAVPIESAVRVGTSLVDYGTPDHPWLGIQGADADQDRLDGLPVDGGVVVLHAFTDGPAARAGLLPGDIVTEVANTPVRTMSDLVMTIRYTGPDAPVVVRYLRNGIERTTEVTLGHRSESPVAAD